MKFFKIFSRRSGNVARERLQNVLIADRVGCSASTLENIRSDMNHVLSKYVEVDTKHTDYKIIIKNGNGVHSKQPVLIAYIPFGQAENTVKDA